MGANDGTITNSMTNEQATKFSSPTVVTSSTAGHHLPYSSDATYSTVLNSFSTALPSPPPFATAVVTSPKPSPLPPAPSPPPPAPSPPPPA
eukprot:277349-Prymnesium_polylepis.3